jgi:DNA repair exonuclease SbcCD ATPase subunit
MRLLHCRVQNVRLHGDLPLHFDPGLTLIGGANESGKSTLVEALHRTLFLKASAAGAPVEALRSRHHPGHPTVELGFEAAGDRWTLAKRFSGSSGSVVLRSERGEVLSGPAAEERLASLLGVGETLGGKQVGRLPMRWAHLWVPQGSSGDNLLNREASSYDLETLIERLEANGGAALQSSHDQWVANQLDTILADTFTARKGDVRRQSPLGIARQAAAQAEATVAEAQARLAAFETASNDLAQLEERLEWLRNTTLPALEQRRQGLRQAEGRCQQLRHRLALRSQELEPLRLRHQALQERSTRLAEVTGAVHQGQGQLQAVRSRVAETSQQLEALAAERQRALANRDGLAQQRQALEQRGQLVARLLQGARLASERQQLRGALEQQRRQRELRGALQRQLAALPAVDEARVRRLRSLERAAGEARVRLESLAAGVELIHGDQAVLLDGRPLLPGQKVRLTEVAELQLGPGVKVRLSPGGGQGLAEGQGTLRRAEQAFQSALAALGLDDLEAAEAVALQRQGLLQRLAGEAGGQAGEGGELSGAGEGAATLERRLEAIDDDWNGLQRELAALAEVRHQEEERDPIPSDLQALEQMHRQLQQTYHLTKVPFRQAEQELEGLGQRQEALRTSLEAARRREAPLETEIQLMGRRQAELLADQASPEALQQLVADGDASLRAAAADLERLRNELAALEAEGGPAVLEGLDQEIARLQEECLTLTASGGAAQQRCEAIASGDPHAALEQAQAALETAQADLQSLGRLCEAQQVLRQLFSEAQADLSNRYSEPLARAVEAYLDPLLSAGGGCRLRCEPGGGFSGLQLSRGGEYFDFAALSGGMREQLGAALRLAMADVLKDAHGGCLPLVFDDAFTYSDPTRVALVRGMLQRAVARGLQVILLTCSPDDYAGLEGSVVRLDPPFSAPA